MLGAGRTASDDLYQASVAFLAESADDGPVRARRDDAATELRQGVIGIVRRFQSAITLETTDNIGKVTDPDTARRAAALIETFAPEGRPSSLAISGERLQTQAQALRDGIAKFEGMKKLAALLDPLLAKHKAAADEVTTEESELAAVRVRLDKARAEAERMRTAGRSLVTSLAAWDRDLEINVRTIFPVRPRLGTAASEVSEEEALEDLDEGGAEDVTLPGEGETPAEPADIE